MTDTQGISSPAQQSGRRRGDRIVGTSSVMRESVDQATRAARSNAPVLISGPPGSGRGHLARSVHAWSGRSSVPLVVFSASGTPGDQHLRELLGVAGSAEPLVDGTRNGALDRAAQGTLLIERIDRLVDDAQRAIAQAIRQQSFCRVGDSEAIPLRARILATGDEDTHARLGGDFETISIPALSERMEDILPLAAHFLAEHAAVDGSEAIGFTSDARRWLVEEPWRGNVRELSERIRLAVRLAGDGAISAEALMLATEGEEVPSFKEAKRAFETRYVEGLLRRCNGNISRAARLAKKDRKDFYDVIRRTGVDPAQFRP